MTRDEILALAEKLDLADPRFALTGIFDGAAALRQCASLAEQAKGLAEALEKIAYQGGWAGEVARAALAAYLEKIK